MKLGKIRSNLEGKRLEEIEAEDRKREVWGLREEARRINKLDAQAIKATYMEKEEEVKNFYEEETMYPENIIISSFEDEVVEKLDKEEGEMKMKARIYRDTDKKIIITKRFKKELEDMGVFIDSEDLKAKWNSEEERKKEEIEKEWNCKIEKETQNVKIRNKNCSVAQNFLFGTKAEFEIRECEQKQYDLEVIKTINSKKIAILKEIRKELSENLIDKVQKGQISKWVFVEVLISIEINIIKKCSEAEKIVEETKKQLNAIKKYIEFLKKKNKRCKKTMTIMEYQKKHKNNGYI